MRKSSVSNTHTPSARASFDSMEAMKRAYWRCNSGHYFSTSTCPLDGWNRPWTHELAEVTRQILSKDGAPSIQALRDSGVKQETLDKVIVIEFGSQKSSFDGFAPEAYFVGGKCVRVAELGSGYI